MSSELKELVAGMKDLNKRVQLLVTLQGLTRVYEVGPTSFVQLLECTPMKEGGFHYQFHQSWVEKMPEGAQKSLEGAYHNDKIGTFKIIGIYDAAPGLEMLGLKK